MSRLCLLLVCVLVGSSCLAQDILMHAHNDYEQVQPLRQALDLGFHSIEVDIIRAGGRLVVSHDHHNLDKKPNLEDLYFKPLFQKSEIPHRLILLVDIKRYDATTIALLHEMLQDYDSFLCRRGDLEGGQHIQIILSGDFPRYELLDRKNTKYFFGDGRTEDLGKNINSHEVPWISTNFAHHSAWSGRAKLPHRDRRKLKRLIRKVHREGKKIRFWNTPDLPIVWETLVDLGVDIIGTDDQSALSSFLK